MSTQPAQSLEGCGTAQCPHGAHTAPPLPGTGPPLPASTSAAQPVVMGSLGSLSDNTFLLKLQ